MSRPLILQFPLFVPPMSMTSTLHSLPTNIQMMGHVGFDVSWTGTPFGTFSVEVSNTYQEGPQREVINVGNWTPLVLSSTVTASGSAGNAFIDVDGVSASWIRLTYTATSGTGLLSAVVSAKVI